MPTFSDNSDYLAEFKGERLNLPVRGKLFSFSAFPSMAEGMEIRKIQAAIQAAAAGNTSAVVVEDEDGLYRRLIGDQWDALAAAGADEGDAKLIGITLLNTYLYGLKVGQQTWTGEIFKATDDLGETEPTGTTTPTPPKAPKRSAGGKRTTKSSPSLKRTSPPTTA